MSGGHFDYLSFKDLGQVVDLAADAESNFGEIQEMLNTHGESKAATDHARFVALVQEINLLAGGLRNVWHAVEWCASGDTGPGSVAAAIDVYGGK